MSMPPSPQRSRWKFLARPQTFISLLLAAVLLPVGLNRLPAEIDVFIGGDQGGNPGQEYPHRAEGSEASGALSGAQSYRAADPRLLRIEAENYLVAAQAAAPASRQARTAYDQASRLLRGSLAASPMEPYIWHKLAIVDYRRNDLLNAAQDWRMSVETGLFDPQLRYIRTQTGLLLWPYMDLDARHAFSRMLYSFWQRWPGELAQIATKFQREGIVLASLAPYPDAAADMDRLFRFLHDRQQNGQ
jgi:hypothetical protein